MDRLVFLILWTSIYAALLGTAFGQVRRVCYFSNAAQFRPVGGKFFPSDIDPSLCSHMVYHKAVIDNDCHIATFEWNDETLYAEFNAFKETNPGLKTLLAVKRTSTECSLSDKGNRLEFAHDSIAFLRNYDFDGLDINFDVHNLESYPEFREDFVALLQEVRAEFNADTSGSETLLLTIDASAKKAEIDEYYDVPNIAPYVDWIGLETYDFRGPGTDRNVGFTYNHAGLFGRSDDTEEDSYLNVDAGTQYWIAQGASSQQILMGVAALSVGFVLEDTQCDDVKCGTTGPSQFGPYTREDGAISIYETCHLYDDGNPDTRWDDEQKVPYTVAGNEWIGHENPESIQAKGQYILDNNLGGWTMWTMDLDDFSDSFCGDGPYPVLTTLNVVTNPNFVAKTPMKKAKK